MTPTAVTGKPARTPRSAPREARPFTRAVRTAVRNGREFTAGGGTPVPAAVRGRLAPPTTRAGVDPSAARRKTAPAAAPAVLARYTDAEGRPREIVVLPGHAGSLLVVDRDAATLGDRRLLAHLAADEPAENAEIVCRDYLRDPAARRCRALAAEDLRTAPFSGRSAERESEPECAPAPPPETAQLRDSRGATHRLEVFDAPDLAIPELRWRRRGGPEEEARPEGVRDVVACL
jgi:hypothetical protein